MKLKADNYEIKLDATYSSRISFFLTLSKEIIEVDMSCPNGAHSTIIPNEEKRRILNGEEEQNESKVFNIISLNARSIRNKRNLMTKIIEDLNPDCIVITEHWLGKEETIVIDDFKTMAITKRSNNVGGGVMILLKNDIDCECEQIERIAKLSVEFVCETVGIQLKYGSFSCAVVGVYRSNSSKYIEPIKDNKWHHFMEIMQEILIQCNTCTNNVILAGDFNVNFLDSCKKTKELSNLLESGELKLLFNEITRKNSGIKKGTCIDNICTNMTDRILNSKIIDTYQLLDHVILSTKINVNLKSSKKSVTKRKINNASLEELRQALESEEWSQVVISNDVNVAYKTFINTFHYYLNIHCPLVNSKHRRKNKKKINWNSDVKLYEDMLGLLKSVSYNDTDNHEILASQMDKYKNKLKQALNISVRSHNDNVIEKADNVCSSTWKLINSVKSEQESSDKGIMLEIQGRPCINGKIVVNHFNDYYLNVPKNIAMKLEKPMNGFDTDNIIPVDRTVYMYETNECEITEIISELKNKNSIGHDGISNRIVKSVCCQITKPLVHIINLAMNNGIFPDELKKTIVKPLFKKGNKLKPENYRPLALSSPFSKISEKVFLRRMMGFLSNNDVIDQNQFGYKKETSCIDAIIYLTNVIAKCKSEKLKVLTIFLDLSKAFDCVDHNTLFRILEKYGIRGVALDLIISYLTKRTQSVYMSSNGKQFNSEFKIVDDGVPQGSIYGPNLFLIYTNCIRRIITELGCDFILYVDDTNIIIYGKSIEEIRERAYLVLKAVYKFFASLNLALNLEKTLCMLFDGNQVPVELSLNGILISQVTSTKVLGINISHNLKWCNHIESVLKQINRGIFVLKQTLMLLSKTHNMLVFNAFIQSFLSYGVIIWGNEEGNKSNMLKLFRKQKRAVRMINGITDSTTTCGGLFKSGNIMTLPCLFIYFSAIYAKVHLKQNKISSKHVHETRSKNKIFVPHQLKGSIEFQCVKIFNKIPSYLSNIKNVKMFKGKLKSYLINGEFYSMDEFFNQ